MFIAVCILAALPYEIAGQYVQGDSCRQWSAAPAEHTTKGHDSMVVDLNSIRLSKDMEEMKNVIRQFLGKGIDILQEDLRDVDILAEHYLISVVVGLRLNEQARMLSVLMGAKERGKTIDGLDPRQELQEFLTCCNDYAGYFSDFMGLDLSSHSAAPKKENLAKVEFVES